VSLFQCENCGCCENTALSSQGFSWMSDYFNWDGIEDRKGKRICSACGPTRYSDGKKAIYGKWHGKFERIFLPIGMFRTAENGNLEHIETGDQDFEKYRIGQPDGDW